LHVVYRPLDSGYAFWSWLIVARCATLAFNWRGDS
jgi:hypothetical protein